MTGGWQQSPSSCRNFIWMMFSMDIESSSTADQPGSMHQLIYFKLIHDTQWYQHSNMSIKCVQAMCREILALLEPKGCLSVEYVIWCRGKKNHGQSIYLIKKISSLNNSITITFLHLGHRGYPCDQILSWSKRAPKQEHVGLSKLPSDKIAFT